MSRRVLAIWAIAIGLASALATCSDSAIPALSEAPAEPASPTPISVPMVTPPTPSSPPTALRLCSPGDVVIGTVWWTGATATEAGGFRLVNVSSTACAVGGRPSSFSLLDPAGHPLALDIESFDAGSATELLALPPQPAGESSVGVEIFWVNWCGAWQRQGTLVVTLPRLGQLRAPITNLSAPRCDSPGSPSVVQVGPIVGPG